MTSLTFFGHAAFRLEREGRVFLFDPFFNGNPLSPVKAEDITADFILVSHGHADHLGDTFEIAARCRATVISTFEIVQICQERGLSGHPMHIGGKFTFDFGTIRVTPAFHGAGIPGGHACGFIVNLNGFSVYFAGDTSLFGDMKLLGEIEDIDVFLVPIGGNFTMDIDDAVYAAKLVGAKTVIPCHYNTWPVIQADPQEFCRKVEKNTNSSCLLLDPGQAWQFI